MTNVPSTSEPIRALKDLILYQGGSTEDLWQRWWLKVTPDIAVKELMKLSSLPHRDGINMEEKALMAIYVDALVKDGVPSFALGAAVACFIRGHVPDQGKFFPSLPELLAECQRQFVAMIKIAPGYDGRDKQLDRGGEWGGRRWEDLPKWMQRRIMDNRKAYEDYRAEGGTQTRVQFLGDIVKASCHTASSRMQPKPRDETLQVIAEAARKREEDHRQRRAGRGIEEGYEQTDIERLMRRMDDNREASQ